MDRATKYLTFDGGTSTLSNGFSSTATGQTIISAPWLLRPGDAQFDIYRSQGGCSTLDIYSRHVGYWQPEILGTATALGLVVLGAAKQLFWNNSSF